MALKVTNTNNKYVDIETDQIVANVDDGSIIKLNSYKIIN